MPESSTTSRRGRIVKLWQLGYLWQISYVGDEHACWRREGRIEKPVRCHDVLRISATVRSNLSACSRWRTGSRNSSIRCRDTSSASSAAHVEPEPEMTKGRTHSSRTWTAAASSPSAIAARILETSSCVMPSISLTSGGESTRR